MSGKPIGYIMPNRNISKILFISLILIAVELKGQKLYYGEPVTITASLLQSPFSEGYRETYIITEEQIKSMPVNSIAEILSVAAPLNIRTRGTGGSQSDISIRGSSFEQVVILVDGIRMNNPQTGHHNLDIPVSVSDIKRIEILPGHASSIYGADAYGGVINIITKSGSLTGTNFFVDFGSFNSVNTGIKTGFSTGHVRHSFSYQKNSSHGHTYDTDYNNQFLNYTSSVTSNKSRIALFAGLSGKNFGAANFYAPFPSREKTSSLFSKIEFTRVINPQINLSAQAYARKHNDHFVLDQSRPEWYVNDHKTYVYGLNFQINFKGRKSELALGSALIYERLVSSSLNNHSQIRSSVFAESGFKLGYMTSVNTGIRFDFQDLLGLETNPTISIKHSISKSIDFRASSGRIFRTPTFTELYYSSPANQGNADLNPETGWSFETGLDIYPSDGLKILFTFFTRKEQNRIDWIRYKDNDVWNAVNKGAARVNGFSLILDNRISDKTKLKLMYQRLFRKDIKASDYISKYDITVPDHNITVSFNQKFFEKFFNTTTIHMNINPELNNYLLVDSKFTVKIKKQNLYIIFKNLLNEKYQMIPGVIMPQRSIYAGFSYSL